MKHSSNSAVDGNADAHSNAVGTNQSLGVSELFQSSNPCTEALQSIRQCSDIPTRWEATSDNDEPSIDGLHESVQSIINVFCKGYNVPREFVVAPIIAAVSAAMGSRVLSKFVNYTNRSNVFVAVIAPSGSNKSKPASDIMKPLEAINKDLFAKSKRDRDLYEMQERARSKAKKADEQAPLERPKQRQLIVTNITEESRISLLADNPHGILQYNDELDTFINNIGKYTKSNEIGELISIYDGGIVTISRIVRDAILLERPYFSLFGTIQPRIAAKRLATDDFYTSGFSPRMLLFQPLHVNYKNQSQADISGELEQWGEIIETIYRKSTESASDRVLTPSADALAMHGKFFNEASDIMSETENEAERAVLSKLKISVWKLAAIARVLNEATQGLISSIITADEMSWAISICKYCYRRQMALLGQTDLSQPKDAKKQAVIAVMKAVPEVNQAKLAELLGLSHDYVRKIKSREVKK